MQLFAQVNGLKIKYDEYGDTNQRHVLLIHGLGTSSIVWRDIPQALSEKFHTICVDLVGFGGSDIPEIDYTINYFSHFVRSFLKQIGIHEGDKISIIGHSLGGYIAAEYAIQNREQVDKLILIDSSGMLKQPTQLLEQYLNAALESDSKFRGIKLKNVFEKMLAHPDLLLPVVVDHFNSAIERPRAKYAFESAFRNSTSTSINPEELKKIKDVPCLIIWGEKDNLIPLDHIDKFRQILSYAEVIKIEDAGHSPFLEKTAIVYHKILTFLLGNSKAQAENIVNKMDYMSDLYQNQLNANKAKFEKVFEETQSNFSSIRNTILSTVTFSIPILFALASVFKEFTGLQLVISIIFVAVIGLAVYLFFTYEKHKKTTAFLKILKTFHDGYTTINFMKGFIHAPFVIEQLTEDQLYFLPNYYVMIRGGIAKKIRQTILKKMCETKIYGKSETQLYTVLIDNAIKLYKENKNSKIINDFDKFPLFHFFNEYYLSELELESEISSKEFPSDR